jgi:hypothetical protein
MIFFIDFKDMENIILYFLEYKITNNDENNIKRQIE